MIKRLLYILCFIAVATFAQATGYYVTQAGDGTADGKSLANAWSVANFNISANWSATEDADKIDPGDTVYFSGTFTTGIEPQGSGTAGNYITLDGYETDDTTFQNLTENSGRAKISLTESYQNQIAIYTWDSGDSTGTGRDYIKIQDFEIENCSHGILMWEGSDHILIQRNFIHDCGSFGIKGSIYTTVGVNNITVGGSSGNGNVVKDVGVGTAGGDVDFSSSNNIIISYNHLYATKSTGASTDRGIDGIVIESSSNTVLIEYNSIHDHNDAYSSDPFGGCGAPCEGKGEDGIDLKRDVDDVIIRYNQIYGNDNGSEGEGGNGIIFNSYPAETNNRAYVYGNHLWENRADCFNTHGTNYNDDIYIFSNICRDTVDGAGFILSASESSDKNYTIYNNTIAKNSSDPNNSAYPGANVSSGGTIVLKNNAWVNNQSTTSYRQFYFSNTSNKTLDYNIYYHDSGASNFYWGASYNFADYKTASSQDANSSEEDPGFVNISTNNYEISSVGSAVYGTGVDMALGTIATVTIQGTAYPVYDDIALGPNTVWGSGSTLPTIDIVQRGGNWDRGAYVYAPASAGSAQVIMIMN